MNALQRAVARAYLVTKRFAGVAVTYHPIEGDSFEVVGVGSVINSRVAELANVQVKSKDRDWTFIVDELAIEGVAITPRKEDRIKVDAGDEIEVYIVSPPSSVVPCWRWADSGHTALIVHKRPR